ncbi:MAG: hypothetical protein M3R13_09265 [Armatimonadota bacterium]|nr:hypothetical protein [Armatimonadota bacterium]
MLIAGLIMLAAQQTPMQVALGAMPGWENAGSEAHRIVMRKNESGFGAQMAGAASAPEAQIPKEYSQIEVLLLPTDAAAVKPRFAKHEQQFPISELYLGEGDDLAWYGSGPIFYLDELSDKLKLNGGDDRLGLLAEGLLSKDGRVSSACGIRLAQKGDDALPHISKAIDKADDQSLQACLYPIGLIETASAERQLVEFYAIDRTRPAAAVALIHVSRPNARECYFDMVRRGLHTSSAAREIAKFGWVAGLPLIERAMESVSLWQDYETMFFAMRSLEGRPLPDDVAAAIHELGGKDGHEARRTLMNYKDVEAVVVLAVCRALSAPKGKAAPANDSVRDLLRSLDRAIVRSLLTRAVTAVRAKWDRDKLTQLLDIVR